MWERFLSALEPLSEAGKLGAMLFQFPPWFTIRRSNKQYLLEVAKRCSPLRVAVEFRHASWFDGDNRDETLEFLRRHHLPYVSVDMPQGHKSSIPPVLAATSDLAVVRFHGHSDKWTSKNIYEKFGYRYSDAGAEGLGAQAAHARRRRRRRDPRAHEQLLLRLRPDQRADADRPSGPRRLTSSLSACVRSRAAWAPTYT